MYIKYLVYSKDFIVVICIYILVKINYCSFLNILYYFLFLGFSKRCIFYLERFFFNYYIYRIFFVRLIFILGFNL